MKRKLSAWSKTAIIIRREYLIRVRKKSFIVMTILGPLLIAALYAIPIMIATMTEGKRDIEIYDETGLYVDSFKSGTEFIYYPVAGNLDTVKQRFLRSGRYALVHIPATEFNVPVTAIIYSQSQPGMNIKGEVKRVMGKVAEALKLKAKGYDPEVLNSIRTRIVVNTVKVNEDGSEKRGNSEVATGLGLAAGLIIYFMLFMFGGQVMRSVIEEKTNRIVEVIISSVRPVQLMFGKIIGVGLVSLTQVALWVLLTLALTTGVSLVMGEKMQKRMVEKPAITSIGSGVGASAMSSAVADAAEQEDNAGKFQMVMDGLKSIDYYTMLSAFFFFFIGGYILYSSLFAAVGGMVDSEQDTQQFILPVTLPLIIAFMSVGYVLNYPDGAFSIWLSMIPLTSPVVMMMRLPFGVPMWQMVLSLLLLYGFTFFTTWLGAVIYRTGILIYGKKPSWKELWRWVRYKS